MNRDVPFQLAFTVEAGAADLAYVRLLPGLSTRQLLGTSIQVVQQKVFLQQVGSRETLPAHIARKRFVFDDVLLRGGPGLLLGVHPVVLLQVLLEAERPAAMVARVWPLLRVHAYVRRQHMQVAELALAHRA